MHSHPVKARHIQSGLPQSLPVSVFKSTIKLNIQNGASLALQTPENHTLILAAKQKMPEPRAISGTGKGKPKWVKSHSQECPGAGNQPRAPGRTLVPSGGGSSVLKKQGYKVEVHQKKQNQGIISWNMGIVAGRSQSRAGTRPPLGCGVRARGVRTGITLEFVLFSSGLRKPGVPHHVHQS